MKQMRFSALLSRRGLKDDLPLKWATRALDDIVRGLKAMMDARGAIASGHGSLAKVAKDLAIEWRLDGPLDEKIKGMPSFRADEQNAA